MLENKIEERLRLNVKSQGGIAYKFTSPQRRSVEDRLCVFPEGVIMFIECKATGKKPTAAQNREIMKHIKLGHIAFYIDSKEEANLLVEATSFPEVGPQKVWKILPYKWVEKIELIQDLKQAPNLNEVITLLTTDCNPV